MPDTTLVRLGGRAHTVTRARLGGYLALQRAQRRIDEAGNRGEVKPITDGLYEYLCLAIPALERVEFDDAPWYEVVAAYVAVLDLNTIPEREKYAILVGQGKDRTVPWDYPERDEILWIHTLATAYHWSKADIEALWPEEAVAYLQEIRAEEQYSREFAYSLSEVAYPYDKATKKSRYKPLDRPAWMVRILRSRGRRRRFPAPVPESLRPSGHIVFPKVEPDE
jgi:hypothetical protein